MTFHEHLAKEVLDSFDKGILTRERLELLCNDLLKGDSLFTELHAEHISSKSEQETVIKFLKKELIHKTCYRQVMKKQYRELKQQKKCNCTICRFERKEISVLKYAQELGELLFAAVKDKCLADVKEGKMQPNTAKRVIDYLEKPYADIKDDKYSILSWHFLKENPKDLPRNEDWVCNQDGLPCWYDIANDQWIDCEGTQIKTTAWCDMPHTRG